jgi:hypothetical protein
MKRVMITRKHSRTELSESSPIETKIEIFRETRVWMAASYCGPHHNGGLNDEGTEDIKTY